jgi:hypothetical protein
MKEIEKMSKHDGVEKWPKHDLTAGASSDHILISKPMENSASQRLSKSASCESYS